MGFHSCRSIYLLYLLYESPLDTTCFSFRSRQCITFRLLIVPLSFLQLYVSPLPAKTGQSSTADERTMNSVIESSNREDSSLLAATQEVRRLIGASYPDAMGVARASLTRMNELSSQAGSSGMSFSGAAAADSTSSAAGGSSSKLFSAAGSVLAPQAGGDDKMLGRQEALATITDLQRARLAADASSLGFSSVRETNVNSIFAGPQSDASSPAIASPPAPATHPPQQQQPPSEGTMQAWLGNGGGDENGTRQGLHVYTLGHLFPRDSLESGNPAWSFDAYGVPVAGPGQDVSQEMSGMDNVHPIAALSAVHQYGDVGGNSASTSTQDPSDTPLLEPISRPGSSQTLRVRRSTFVPGWAVSPRVLLVDDDAVNRKLSSKFLQVFGCTIDVAVDGVGAVQKMNLEKYDLVLMVSTPLIPSERF
jgi:osomolarity two-component system response regulator SKN7